MVGLTRTALAAWRLSFDRGVVDAEPDRRGSRTDLSDGEPCTDRNPVPAEVAKDLGRSVTDSLNLDSSPERGFSQSLAVVGRNPSIEIGDGRTVWVVGRLAKGGIHSVEHQRGDGVFESIGLIVDLVP